MLWPSGSQPGNGKVTVEFRPPLFAADTFGGCSSVNPFTVTVHNGGGAPDGVHDQKNRTGCVECCFGPLTAELRTTTETQKQLVT